jgi:NAD(P)-dependent dehydrogenase (short-subunit alcohol dehydrogenase family)
VIDFTGQVAVVTGAGRGLGRLYALELARRGAAVVVNDLGGTMHGHGADPSVADEVVAEIEKAGGTAVASHEPVASPEGGAAIVRTALDRFGRLDALVSNAGIFQTVPFEDLSHADWRRMLEVHLDGGFHLAQPAFRAMKEQGYGRFVFIASSAGLFGQPLSAHYAAAKAGLVGLTSVIAIEGAPHDILANAVLPFGFSRMVSETVTNPGIPREVGLPECDPPGAGGAPRGLPREPRLHLHPSQLLGRGRALRAGLHRPRPRLARGARQRSDRGGLRGSPRGGLGRAAVRGSGVDRRRGAWHV